VLIVVLDTGIVALEYDQPTQPDLLGRRLLGSQKGPGLPDDFDCENPDSMIVEVNAPDSDRIPPQNSEESSDTEKLPSDRRSDHSTSETKGSHVSPKRFNAITGQGLGEEAARSFKKAAEAVKGVAKKAAEAAKKAAKKAAKAVKGAAQTVAKAVKGAVPLSSEICCPDTKQCFTFCHKNCRGFQVKGLGTVFAQYKTPALTAKREQRALGRAGPLAPCSQHSLRRGLSMSCENKHARFPKTPLEFNSKKLTIASNGKCAVKWGFLRTVSKATVASGEETDRLGDTQLLGERKKKDEKRLEEITYYVDELHATVCNLKTGKCAQRKVLINCLRNSKPQTRECTQGEALTFSHMI
jgi:hypothetical protein